ncbi:MAG: proline dehydrogenase family protein [Flavobacteriaceae bacterium]|jgi:proline dehydrogenase|nr:proline dehydrogenase family protein [Flavobacteriaceae bacterium]
MRRIFEDTATAFALKSDTELERAYFLFKLIANEPLVKVGTAVTNFAIKAHLPVEGLIRATVFDHFCAGVSEDDSIETVDKLFSKNVHSIFDYSVEGKVEEYSFDQIRDRILNIFTYLTQRESLPFAVFKPTAMGSIEIYQKKSEGKLSTDKDLESWNRIGNRIEAICQKASQNTIPVLVDAEESWMQDAADDLLEELMEKYNKEEVIVINTIQAYRWDRLEYLKGLVERAKAKGFKIGIKLVRGAYMEKENERAQKLGYKSPICESKAATDENYNTILRFMMDHIDSFLIFAGTHNEDSNYLLMDLIDQNALAKNDPRIWFGQLYGMSDHISFNLSKEGYNVSKYLPFGPVKDVMPYLMRRAEENTSVAGQTSRELSLLKKERDRRKLL